MAKEIAYLLKKRENESFFHTKLDSSHSFGMTNNAVCGMTNNAAFGMTNNAVISTEGRNLYRQESLGLHEFLSRYERAKTTGGHASPFERIKRTNDAGMEFWSSRDFSGILDYGDYRNFEGVIEKAKMACFNSGYRIEDHFVDVTDMIEIGKGGQRPVKTVLLSRYACYLAIQNADPKKEIVAHGQTYFATQTRRQELTDERIEDERRVLLREEIRRHNVQLADAAKGAGVISLHHCHFDTRCYFDTRCHFDRREKPHAQRTSLLRILIDEQERQGHVRWRNQQP